MIARDTRDSLELKAKMFNNRDNRDAAVACGQLVLNSEGSFFE